jgi:hypothetical protein
VRTHQICQHELATPPGIGAKAAAPARHGPGDVAPRFGFPAPYSPTHRPIRRMAKARQESHPLGRRISAQGAPGACFWRPSGIHPGIDPRDPQGAKGPWRRRPFGQIPSPWAG